MKWPTEITQLLKIQYPIIQAPMLGVTSPEMVAAISNAGGLGSLPVGGLSPERTLELIKKTKALTNKPFAVNLFTHSIPAFDKQQVENIQVFLEQLSFENNLKFEKLDIDKIRFYTYQEQIEILVAEQIPVVSFTFGVLDDTSIKALHNNGAVLIGTATCIKEAQILDDLGIDLISVQGIEAGGHRGTFLEDEPFPQIGLISLVAQIIDAVKRPVIAAGGIFNSRTIKAAFALGAAGVQIGSAFIACNESIAISAYKSAVQNSTDSDSVLTKAFSGRWARGLKNKFMEAIDISGLTIPAYPMQNSLTALLRASAQQQNNKQFTNLWAGQSANKAEMKSAGDILIKMIAESEI